MAFPDDAPGVFLMPTGEHTFTPMMTEQARVVFEGDARLMTALLFEQPGKTMRFVRVHRSAVANIESILQLEARSHGEFDIVFKNGSRSRVSRTYRAHLEKRLGQPL